MNRRSFMTALGVGAAAALDVGAVTPSRHFAQKAEAADYGIPYWCRSASVLSSYKWRVLNDSGDPAPKPVEAILYIPGQNAKEVIELVGVPCSLFDHGLSFHFKKGELRDNTECWALIQNWEWVIRTGSRIRDHLTLSDRAFRQLFQNA